MKTQNQTDKATARPWSYRPAFANGEPCGYVVQSGASCIADIPQGEDDAALIVRAVNSYAALKAVADAAKFMYSAMGKKLEPAAFDSLGDEALTKFHDALANLAAIEKGSL